MSSVSEILADAEHRMDQSIAALSRELVHLRAGRADSGLVDHIKVEAYGELMPLNQLATISTPDASTIMISPFDKSQTSAVEKAINTSDLGLMPQSDGSLIRIAIPPLTEERRKDLSKAVNSHAEDGRVALRNIRRDANESIKKLNKAKDLSDDLMHDNLEKIDKLLEKQLKVLEERVADKQRDITEF